MLFRVSKQVKRPYVPVKESAFAPHRHNRQLLNRAQGQHTELLRRSAFGLVRVYNALPADIIQHTNVREFQRALTCAVKEKCKSQEASWQFCFSPRPHVDATTTFLPPTVFLLPTLPLSYFLLPTRHAATRQHFSYQVFRSFSCLSRVQDL